MPDVTLYHGDCLDVMAGLEAESVDTVITDPPYGLEFMGKEWDKLKSPHWRTDRSPDKTGRGSWFGDNHDAPRYGHDGPAMQEWHYRWAVEALRVAKPGAMLCAFGGTRTHHRLMCAIEDAGWEIRDVLMWLYGSGFPKSHNLSKAIDRARHDDVRPVCRFLRASIDASEETVKTLASKFGFHPRMVEHWAARDTDSQPTVPKWDQWLQLKTFVGFDGEMDAEVWRLNGRKGKPGDAWAEREVIGHSDNQIHLANLGDAGYKEEWDITSPATDAAALWDGYGTALKPAYEPIILAMKPLPGTFAQNALGYGVAGLNVDGCRVGTNGESTARHSTVGELQADGWGTKSRNTDGHPQGRWPANLLLSHAPGCECVGVRKVKGSNGVRGSAQNVGKLQSPGSGWGTRNTGEVVGYADADGYEQTEAWNCVPECPVRLLDEQSGERRNGGQNATSIKGDGMFMAGDKERGTTNYAGDTGGASRFFTRFHYSAKASRAERELGLLGHIPCLKCGLLDSVTHLNTKTGKEEKCRRNGHPTVKPLDVCRWLCRLTKTPTGGVVLDPFAGSGRISMAAILEGRDTIGIELERPSFEIAQAAVRWAQAEHAQAKHVQLVLEGAD